MKGLRALVPVEPKMVPDEVLGKENEGFESMCADRAPQLRNCFKKAVVLEGTSPEIVEK